MRKYSDRRGFLSSHRPVLCVPIQDGRSANFVSSHNTLPFDLNRMVPAAGIYHLLLYLERPRRLRVGSLGFWNLPSGYYVYTGSAVRGFGHRLARHARERKPRHWHIDYLTCISRLEQVRVHAVSRGECRSHRAVMKIPGAVVIVPGFGSSDCRCPAHLAYFERRPVVPGIEYPVTGRQRR